MRTLQAQMTGADRGASDARDRPNTRVSPAVEVDPARLAFVDLARAAAALMMIQGHALDALLLPEYRTTTGFYLWSFGRGLTSCLFLFLSGFVFTTATHRRWREYTRSLEPNIRRLRRAVGLIVLGYLLHYPGGPLAHLWSIDDESWRRFLAVDILQCIAVSLCFLQALVLVTTPDRFRLATATACVAVVMATPAVWSTDALDRLPVALSAYLSPRTGSLFPIFPWAAYMLLGATFGEVYQRRRAAGTLAFARLVLAPTGLVMVSTALVCSRLPFQPLGATDFWTTSPNQFLLRAGLVLLVVGGIAHGSRLLARSERLIGPLAKETLLVYVAHICLVYGSAWNTGLFQRRGHAMGPAAALGCVAALWIVMVLAAAAWNTVKRYRARDAQWLRLAGVSALVFGLL